MERINLSQRLTMSLVELEDYYRKQRQYYFEQGKPLKYIRLRKAFQPLFVRLLTVDRWFRKQTITILGTKPLDTVVFFTFWGTAGRTIRIFFCLNPG